MGLLSGCMAQPFNDVPLSICPENFGQTQKLLFWQVFDAAGAKNKFEPNKAVTPTDPRLIADWTTFLAAEDETKPVQSPFIAEPTSEPGAERTYGGGNATRDGALISLGKESQLFEAKFLSAEQLSIKALKTFQLGTAGTGGTIVGVIPINEAGQMMFSSNGLARNSVTYELYPIPITKLFFSDKGLGGFEAVDHNMVSFQMKPDWSDLIEIITPTDFDGLEDLVNT